MLGGWAGGWGASWGGGWAWALVSRGGGFAGVPLAPLGLGGGVSGGLGRMLLVSACGCPSAFSSLSCWVPCAGVSVALLGSDGWLGGGVGWMWWRRVPVGLEPEGAGGGAVQGVASVK